VGIYRDLKRIREEYRRSLEKLPGQATLDRMQENPVLSFSPSSGLSSAPSRKELLSHTIDKLDSDVRFATAELANLESRLRHFRYPAPPLIPLVLLVVLTVFGVVMPLIMIPVDSLHWGAKLAVSASIAIGVFGLIGYLFYEFIRGREGDKN